MRIVDRKTFLSLPDGILFSTYRSQVFDDLEIKGESFDNDYCYQSLADAIECDSSDEHHERLLAMERAGASIPVDLNCQARDGCFGIGESGILYAVWEQDDLDRLIERLKQCRGAIVPPTIQSNS